MDHETRIMVAFALSFLMLVAWRVLLVKETPPPSKTAPAPKLQATTAAQQPVTKFNAAPVRLPTSHGTKPEEIVIDGDLYQVTLSTEGAVVKSWILKKYRDEKEQLLDVVNREACEKLGFPMSLSLADPALADRVNTALYVTNQPAGSLKAPVTVEMVYSDGKIQVKKKFSFGSGYEMLTEMSVSDGQRYFPIEVAWPGGFGDHSLPQALQESATQAVYGTPESISKVAERKLSDDRMIPGPLTLAGSEDRYFAAIFLPDSPDQAVFRLGRRAWAPAESKDKQPKPLIAMLGSPQPRPLSFRLVVAPKDLDVLRSVKPPLDGLLDFGWFSLVAKPLFLILRYIYDHWAHNYGWAIVILTVGINLAMFPLKVKSIRSAQEMQRIAPIVKGIQDRYKQYKFNDPRKQKMNQEIMKLYQDHGINPLGGCLPMVIQLPFLYGFYSVLNLAIELRHAPWIWCIKDLSSPDKCHPFGIPVALLPTVMIVTMFVLQKMTPMTTPDPSQQRMMMIMPLIFGVMFYNLASGLVLYWLTSNIVGIAQQALINRIAPVSAQLPVPRKTADVKQ